MKCDQIKCDKEAVYEVQYRDANDESHIVWTCEHHCVGKRADIITYVGDEDEDL